MSGEEANPLGVVLHMDEEAGGTEGANDQMPEMIRAPSSPLARGGKFASSSGSPLAQGLSSSSSSSSTGSAAPGSLRTTPLNPARLTRGPSEFNLGSRTGEQQRTPNEQQRTPSAYALQQMAPQPPSQPSSPPALLIPAIQPFETDVVPHPRSSPKSPQRSEPMFIRDNATKGWMQYIPAVVALFIAVLTLCMLAYVWWRVDNVERAVAGYTAGQSVGLQATQVDNALLVASTLQTAKAEFGTTTGDFTYARPVSPTGVVASTSVVQGQDATSEAGGDLVLRSGQGGGFNGARSGDIVLQVPGMPTTTGARRLLVDSPTARDVVTISGSAASYHLSATSVNFASDAEINMQATKVLIDAPLQTPIHNVSLIAAQQALTINFASLPGGAVRLKGAMTIPLVTLQFTGCTGSTAISTLHLINGLNVDVQVPSSACRRPTNVPVFDVFVRAGDSAAFTCWAGSLQCPLDGAIVSLNQRLANITSGTGTGTGGGAVDLSPLLARLSALEAAMSLKANAAALNDLNATVTAAIATIAAKADVAALNTGLAAKADVTALDALASTASVTAALALKANISELASYATVDALNLKADASALSTYALASDLAAKADTTALADYVLTTTLANYSLAADVATALASKAATADVASTYATIASVASQITPLAVRADVDASLALKANVTDVQAALALKADIALLGSYSADLSGYATAAQTNQTIAAAIAKALETVVDITVLDSTVAALQSSIATASSLKANQSTVDALLQQVATNTADIALRATNTALTFGLALKADVTALNAVESSLTAAIALKANSTTVTAINAQVLTNTAGIGLCAVASTVNATLALKADASALANTNAMLIDGLSLKANRTELAVLATTAALTAGLSLKADTTALAAYATTGSLAAAVSSLNTSIGLKASKSSVDALTLTVTGLTASKLSVSDFTAFQTDNTAALDSKALATDLYMKVDLTEMSQYALATDLALKADISMVPNYAQIDWFYPMQFIEKQVSLLTMKLQGYAPSLMLSNYPAVLMSKTLRTPGHNRWDTTDTYNMN